MKKTVFAVAAIVLAGALSACGSAGYEEDYCSMSSVSSEVSEAKGPGGSGRTNSGRSSSGRSGSDSSRSSKSSSTHKSKTKSKNHGGVVVIEGDDDEVDSDYGC
jgi:hypothetical protein